MVTESIIRKTQTIEKKYGKVMSMEQASQYLGTDTKTLCALVRNGELEAIEMDGLYAFKPIQLVKFEYDITAIPEFTHNTVMEREVNILKVSNGSIYKIKNNNKNPFQMRFYITFDDGKKTEVRINGTSREELLDRKQERVAEELRKYRSERNGATELPQRIEEKKKHTFREVSEMWYEEFRRENESKGNSYANLESAKYGIKSVNSVIGEMDISEIDRNVAQDMINAISKDSNGNYRSKSYVEKAMRKFKAVMEYALEEGYIDRQVGKLHLNKNLKTPDKDARFVDRDTLKILFDCIKKNNTYNTLINLIFSSGLRQEEALALTIDDIQYNDGIYQIHVSKALVEVENHRYAIIDRLKHDEKARYVAIAKEVYELVIGYYDDSIKDENLNKKRKENNTEKLIFVNKDGRTHNKRTLYRSLRNYLERNMDDIGKVRLHMLRHTFASLMKNEIPIETVSEILGHKDISTTIKFYASQTAEDYRRTSIGVESMMKKIKE